MPQFADVQTFIDQSRRVTSPDELHGVLQGVAREMAFDHFALVHHVNLRPFGAFEDHVLTSEFVALSDYP